MPNEEKVPNKPNWANTQLAVVDRSGYTISANDPRWEIRAQGKLFWTALVREKAYADLFAAAPDLYEALDLLMSEEGVDDAYYCDSDTNFMCPTCKARAALKKARGEA